MVTWQGLDLELEDEVPAVVEEGQGERLRRSLVLLDVNLPAVALPDGVHCRAFTGAGRGACSGTNCLKATGLHRGMVRTQQLVDKHPDRG